MSSPSGINRSSPSMRQLETSQVIAPRPDNSRPGGSVSGGGSSPQLQALTPHSSTATLVTNRAPLPSARASSASAPAPETGFSPAPTRGGAKDWAEWYAANASKVGTSAGDVAAGKQRKLPEELPPRLQEALRFLEKTDDLKQYSSPKELIDHLRQVNDSRPGVEFFSETKSQFRVFPGEMDPSKNGFPKNWDLGTPTAHAVPTELDPATTTSLAHVTRPSALRHFDHAQVNVDSGEGEFGKGFYLTTGHETAAQNQIASVWNKPGAKENLQEVLRFDVGNNVLRKMVETDGQRDFLVHVMQNRNGYPEDMTEQAAVEMINQINAQGKVLIFPDNKDTKVKIDSTNEKSWHEYVEMKGGTGDHYMVIGPQKPDDLQGIRQIAMRYQMGEFMINSVPRSHQQM
ncbi:MULTISPECIES: hypothetical protein [Burkholderia cepacia complex]|uniref:hypothetical protein n=1 Tax=Burkholderia cepacia complex TaxID=87882 RepID=UPI00157A7506|nr:MULTISPECIES: hypothetical protein [Burkholderia cepacia complex]NTY39477.1 hypothetical protein [Burkholderia diffusa]